MERTEREKFRKNMILNYAEHLLPAKEKFKDPLIQYYYFIKFGSHIDSYYTPIVNKTIKRIFNRIPEKYQYLELYSTLKVELMNVSTVYYINLKCNRNLNLITRST